MPPCRVSVEFSASVTRCSTRTCGVHAHRLPGVGKRRHRQRRDRSRRDGHEEQRILPRYDRCILPVQANGAGPQPHQALGNSVGVIRKSAREIEFYVGAGPRSGDLRAENVQTDDRLPQRATERAAESPAAGPAPGDLRHVDVVGIAAIGEHVQQNRLPRAARGISIRSRPWSGNLRPVAPRPVPRFPPGAPRARRYSALRSASAVRRHLGNGGGGRIGGQRRTARHASAAVRQPRRRLLASGEIASQFGQLRARLVALAAAGGAFPLASPASAPATDARHRSGPARRPHRASRRSRRSCRRRAVCALRGERARQQSCSHATPAPAACGEFASSSCLLQRPIPDSTHIPRATPATRQTHWPRRVCLQRLSHLGHQRGVRKRLLQHGRRPSSRCPIAAENSAYPDTKSTGTSGSTVFNRPASAAPLILGMTMSLSTSECRPGMPRDDLQRLHAVAGFQHGIPAGFQEFAGQRRGRLLRPRRPESFRCRAEWRRAGLPLRCGGFSRSACGR